MARSSARKASWRRSRRAGRSDAIDARSDVYGLGAILFLLLTESARPGRRSARAAARARPRAAAGRDLRSGARVRSGRRAIRASTALADDVAAYRDGTGRRGVSARRIRADRDGSAARYRTAILLVLAYMIMRAAVAILAGRRTAIWRRDGSSGRSRIDFAHARVIGPVEVKRR